MLKVSRRRYVLPTADEARRAAAELTGHLGAGDALVVDLAASA